MNPKLKYKIRDIIFILIIIGSFFIYDNYIKNNNNVQYREEPVNKIISKENFSIHFIDIGEGDSIIINSNNEYALIDTGKYEYKNKLINYIKRLDINEFKYVFATHAHDDHIGSMATIIREYKVDRFFIPNQKSNNKSYEYLLKELNKKNIALETPNIDDEFILNDKKIKIIYLDQDKEDLNDTSIILKVTYKNNTFLLTGDATKEEELKTLDKDLKSDLLKIAHHGSKYSSSAQFLTKVKPEYAIISVGKDNEYHHPHQITLDKLNKLNAKIYRTDINGNIIAYSDGNNIYIETEKE